MKKIFTLISVALVAMSANAQTPINFAAVSYDGTSMKLSAPFAAVAGETGGTANNTVDGKSVINVYNDNGITVTAVGGTTPANAEGGGQQITPDLTKKILDKDETHGPVYAISSVETWNNVEWKTTSVGGKGHSMNNGDKEPIYTLDGTGNPYVDIFAEEIITDEQPTGNYRAYYQYYQPDGSNGLPTTGLYYSFKSDNAGAFKVMVWANNGNRPTYVVNATTGSEQFAKAQTLIPEGYINGQDWHQEDVDAGLVDASMLNKRKYLTSTQIAATRTSQTDPFIIGQGNQPFWGYLLFDVNAGDEYWIFQPSSQIGFGGFTFVPGAKKEDLVTGIKGVQTVNAEQNPNAPIYNLAGQQVTKSYKGVVIQNGKKFFQK